MNNVSKTRFAPSPTGLIHLGNMRTALFNYLYAHSVGAKFYIRVEDTDKERSTEEHLDKLLLDLDEIGLSWEAKEVSWMHSIIKQSERDDIYQEYFNKLIESDMAYPCFCTSEELAKSREQQLKQGLAPKYAGTCRNLSKEEVAKKFAAGMKASLRFKVVDKDVKEISFIDLVQGKKEFKLKDLGDFIIRKSDQGAAFFFSNAIDDALSGITHVLRGEDHLTNTPRQLLLLAALKFKAPKYGHLPLIVGKDKKPLSKRNGSLSVHECLKQGYLPIALLNYLARLGHTYKKNDLLSLSELSDNFSLTKVGRAPACFDLEQLQHWQKMAITKTTQEDFYKYFSDEFCIKWEPSLKEKFYLTVKDNILNKNDFVFWQQQLLGDFIYSSEAKDILSQTDKEYFKEAIKYVEELKDNYKLVMQQLGTSLSIKGKKLFMPMRAALTGQLNGPELAKVFTLLGEDQLITRLRQAINEK